MKTRELKARLIKKIEAADDKVLLVVDQVLDNLEHKPEDFFDNLPEEIQELLLKSINQIEDGQTYSQQQVREMTRERYGFKR